MSPLLQVRRVNLIRDTQRKLDKQKRLLHGEEEAVGGVNYQDFTGAGDLMQMDSDKQGFRCVYSIKKYHVPYIGKFSLLNFLW